MFPQPIFVQQFAGAPAPQRCVGPFHVNRRIREQACHQQARTCAHGNFRDARDREVHDGLRRSERFGQHHSGGETEEQPCVTVFSRQRLEGPDPRRQKQGRHQQRGAVGRSGREQQAEQGASDRSGQAHQPARNRFSDAAAHHHKPAERRPGEII
jgi:hypothetical protein